MTDEQTPSISRPERILAYMVVTIVAVSIAAFVAVMVGTATGLEQGDFAVGVWPVVTILPLVGLPIAFLMLITLIIVGAVRRSRESRGQSPR
ncbi:multidrug ABC transporter ATPase [Plantibacter sp. VKM Ac-2885]|nr:MULTISPECIES: multidrug ABC transporter ATPase [Plantibacter]MBD8102235.1 multidrug ABC transporter ATPase [Plantibacter sp. CFBP 8775]MBD8467099.1 multidrug ABC transporter ATPase [Plantibacter sp. CFBP 8798]MBD8516250.1 multidrug ABC transporter ATPase [Plantibacter sp. CFBP 8804]MBD8533684.1 multidrug ABC transporter ATPase [Plantibacter sp. CFBP 13570]MBF4512332.1 multidrug ABC transporter ATPase [Plantibacter sp. VKM Ac-2885]